MQDVAINIEKVTAKMIKQIVNELKNGEAVLYLGCGIFKGLKFESGEDMPYDSNSIIFALNDGKPMAPRLMYEYTRAAMDMEQRAGRGFLEKKLSSIYSKPFADGAVLRLVEKLMPKYIIDTNYDDAVLKLYSKTAHSVIFGKSRIGAELDRLEVFEMDMQSGEYVKIDKNALSTDNPIIFKPMGCVHQKSSFIISDADFVDWLTEAMGGFAVPPVLKQYRENKKYLMLGIGFEKDTERMVANELTIGLSGGYLVDDKEPAKNCEKYLKSHKMEFILSDVNEFAAKLVAEL
jgi:hypothetical protein